jgi:glucans biosynthesis protein
MRGQPLRRRDVLTGLGALGLTSTVAVAAIAGAGVTPLNVAFEVRRRAIALARGAYLPPTEQLPPALAAMGYDEYRDLRFRPERAVWHDLGLGFELQFFPAAYIYRSPVEIYLVEQGRILPVAAARGLFDFSLQDHRVPVNAPLSFSGFRIHAPLNTPDRYDEFMVFQGSSYFRGLGKGHSYGLSARGLAIGTGSPRPEEFPLFRAFWIERPRHAQSITVHALLDSPSVTGAYTFHIWPGAGTRMDVTAELFPRRDLMEVGLAPLTSMFLKDTHDDDGPADFRPAVHDSEGLAVWNAREECLWRPLVSPPQVQHTILLDDNLRGFGLIQRARSFAAYEDLEANYHTRPSAWVEPRTWGDGAVQLVELPANEEYYDNIVAFWRPIAGLKAGVPYAYAYRLTWAADTPAWQGYRVVKTRVGRGGTPHHIRFIVDFAQTDRRADSEKAAAIRVPDPIASVRASHGVAGRPHVQRNLYTGGVRVSFEFDPAAAGRSDLRLDLGSFDGVSSESWRYRWLR